jgi:hypothetical protein
MKAVNAPLTAACAGLPPKKPKQAVSAMTGCPAGLVCGKESRVFTRGPSVAAGAFKVF